MDYSINFNTYKNNFCLPELIIDDDFKDMDSDFLKVILLIFKNPDKSYSVSLISSLLSMDDKKVEKALLYWIDKGVLLTSDKPKKAEVTVVSESVSTTGVNKTNDAELKFLIDNMENLLCRGLTSTDIKTITYIYEYYRMPVDVILMAIQYSVSKGKKDIRYIEKVCVNWVDNDINTHTKAEQHLNMLKRQKDNENKIIKLFGIKDRNLIPSEKKFIDEWFNTLNYDVDIIKIAFERTVEHTGKVAFAYINKILVSWHSNGYKTVADIDKYDGKKQKKKSSQNTSYDIDELDEFWNRIPSLD